MLQVLRSHSLSREAAVIGEVVNEHSGLIMMKTRVDGTRVVDMLSAEQLPRICKQFAKISHDPIDADV